MVLLFVLYQWKIHTLSEKNDEMKVHEYQDVFFDKFDIFHTFLYQHMRI